MEAVGPEAREDVVDMGLLVEKDIAAAAEGMVNAHHHRATKDSKAVPCHLLVPCHPLDPHPLLEAVEVTRFWSRCGRSTTATADMFCHHHPPIPVSSNSTANNNNHNHVPQTAFYRDKRLKMASFKGCVA